MTTIPDDVMAAAWRPALEAVSQVHTIEAVQVAIARAILAERERCESAVIAERVYPLGTRPRNADPCDLAHDRALSLARFAIKGA